VVWKITKRRKKEILNVMKLVDILFENSWDDWDFDPRTGKLAPKKQQPKEEPDEPDGGSLGQYVFGDIRKSIGQNINEPDTDLEKKIYNALVFYTSFNNKELLNNVAKEMKRISDSGKYKSYFSVPSATVWRVLIGLSKSSLENILNKEVTEQIGTESNVVISPRSDSSFTGWTLDAKATIKIYSQAKFESAKSTTVEDREEEHPYLPPEYLKEEDSKEEKYVLLAKCDTKSNPFFFNIDAAMKYLSVGGSPYDFQKEVLAYGDVTASKVAYKKISGPTNPVPELINLLK
jgi:hypothetical protein